MPEDNGSLIIGQKVRIEKRTDSGEIYEIIELEVIGDGNPPKMRVILRRKGLAPPEAYAPWGVDSSSS
jgi:hypothetical protein